MTGWKLGVYVASYFIQYDKGYSLLFGRLKQN